MNKIVIETNKITKKYKKEYAIRDIDIKINKGDIYGLIGPNGAGKTTIMKIIAGLISATNGNVNKSLNFKSFSEGIGVLIESPSFYPNLNARNNMKLFFDLMGEKDYKRIDELLNLVNLNDTGKKIVSKFSLGMKQRLGIAIALINRPEFLILDEPTNGLDPEGIIEIRKILKSLSNEGITIMISSHILDELSKLATRYGIINKGIMVKEFDSKDIENDSKKIILNTSSNSQVLDIINREYKSNVAIIQNNRIIIDSEFIKSSDIAELVIKEGYRLQSIYNEKQSLESYYISLTGGRND